MRLTATQVAGHLRQPLLPCYLVAGEEPLLVTETQDAIRAAACRQGFTERETLDVERDFDWSRLLELCATGSLFASRRVVELRLSGPPGESGAQALKQLAQTPPSDVVLLVVAGRLDARTRKSGWVAALERAGAMFYAWPLRNDEFPRWLAARVQAAGLQADDAALALLVQRTDGNLLAAAQEVMKLAQLHPGARLDVEMVTAAVADAAHYGVFDWIDRMLAGDGAAAVRGLMRLREEGEALPMLVAALAADLHKLAQLCQGVDPLHAGVFRMRRSAFARARARLRPGHLPAWLQRLAQIDVQAKTGAEEAGWQSLLGLSMAVAGIRRRSAGRATRV